MGWNAKKKKQEKDVEAEEEEKENDSIRLYWDRFGLVLTVLTTYLLR